MGFDLEIHHRRSIRLQRHDYSRSGAYFITICACNRENAWGTVAAGSMVLTPCGEIVRDEWKRTALLRRDVELDEYIVMPNHLHGILRLLPSLQPVAPANGVDPIVNGGQWRSPAHTIGAIVRGFKAAASKRINDLQNTPGVKWFQRNYWERILRDEREIAHAREYIRANPARWVPGDTNC